MKSLFITGVGGFIGRRLAERALSQGVRVSGVDVSPDVVREAQQLGVEAHEGDITDERRMRDLVGGVDTVIHTAAIVREYGALEVFRRVNVEGSLNVARAARDAGARRFVQLSSVMVYGFDYPPNVDEAGPLRGENNPYCQTKIESEAAVLSLNQPGTFGVIVIRPGDVYGPGSVPWVARPLDMLSKGRLFLPMKGRGVINHVFVDNLVDGIFLALEKEADGETFNVSDGEATTNERYFSLLAGRAKLPGPRSLPTPLMTFGARVVTKLRERGLTKDEASVDTVRYLQRRHPYSIEKARRLLGYAPRISLAEGLERTQPFIDAWRTRRESRHA